MPALLKFLVLIPIFLLASNANAFTSPSPVAVNQVQENHWFQFVEPMSKPTIEPSGEPTDSSQYNLPAGLGVLGLLSARTINLPAGLGLQSANSSKELPAGLGLRSANFTLPAGLDLCSANSILSAGLGLRSARTINLPAGLGLRSANSSNLSADLGLCTASWNSNETSKPVVASVKNKSSKGSSFAHLPAPNNNPISSFKFIVESASEGASQIILWTPPKSIDALSSEGA
jgi:hypothetical protein